MILILLFAGIDEQLAKHIAHFFIRDPISLFSGKINVDDENELEHFDVSIFKMYSTRFKFAACIPKCLSFLYRLFFCKDTFNSYDFRSCRQNE